MALSLKGEAKNTTIYLAGAVGAAVIGFVNTPFLTRALSASDYAIYGLLTSFMSFVTTMAYLGYDEAYMRFYHERRESLWKYLWRCIRWPLVVGVFVSCLLLEPSGVLARFIFGEGIPFSFVLGCSLYLMFGVFQRFLMLTARMEEKALSYAAADILARFVPLALIIVGWMTAGEVNLPWIALYLALGSVVAILAVLPAFHSAKSRYECTQDSKPIRLAKYGFPLALGSTFSFFVPFLERILLRELLGQNLLGVYSAASVFATIIGLLSVSINNVWMPFVYKNYNEDDFDKVFGLAALGVTLFISLVCAFCIAVRKLLILILGSDFWAASSIAPDILFGACLIIVGNMYSIGIYLSKKSALNIATPIAQCVSLPIFFYLLVPQFGLAGAGAASLLATALGQLVRTALALRERAPKTGVKKSVSMVAIGIICCLSSGIFDSLISDLIIGVLLASFAIFVCRKEIERLFPALGELISSKLGGNER